jgi:hypothetical protein
MKRVRWEVRYDKRVFCWRVFRQKESVAAWSLKANAIHATSQVCRERLRAFGELSELTIKKKNGQIQDKRTYGKDPRGTKG